MKIFKALYLLIFLCPAFVCAQVGEQRIKTKIDNVTVFLSGAQTGRSADVRLKKGSNRVTLEGLPAQIDEQSLQVSGTGDFTILSAAFRQNYLDYQTGGEEAQKLQEKLDGLRDELKLKQALKEVVAAEEAMLKANQSVSGTQSGVRVAELREAAEYYRSRMTDIKTRQVKAEQELVKLNQDISSVQNQLDRLNSKRMQPSGEVVLSISSASDAKVTVNISYTVYDAGWTPFYDVRAKNVESPLDITCKAQVFQNTGEDWKDVKLTLSTGNPAQSGVKPDLQPWYLNFYTPAPQSQRNAFKGYSADYVMEEQDVELNEVVVIRGGAKAEPAAPKAFTSAQYTSENEGATSIEYAVEIPASIPSGGESPALEYKKYELPAVYEYYAVRKLDKDAFLLARATGWEKLNLISGETNLFFEGTFVGKSYMDVRRATDTLDLSLGRDKGIIVTRIKGKDYSEKRIVGSSQRESREWDLTVRNTKKQEITIVVEDQIPVSVNREIEVSATDISGASLNPDTGKLSWNITLRPGESRQMKIKYEVKYPKNRRLTLE